MSIRIGLDPIVSLIPGIGDLIANLTGSLILLIAAEYRLPKVVLLRMGMNIAIYFIGGLLPWVGDLFDAWWKPNIRNLRLLRLRATVSADKAHEGRRSDWLFVGLIVATLSVVLFGSLALSAFVIWSVFKALQ